MKTSKILYLISGHEVIDGKGTGSTGFIDEAVEAAKFCYELALMLRSDGFTVYRDQPTWKLRTVVANIRSLIKPNDILVDYHFNSFHKPTATGTESFVPVKYVKAEIDLATDLSFATGRVLGIPIRRGKLIYPGVKLENESQHKELALLGGLGIGVNVLHELCFVSNKTDTERFKKYRKMLLEAHYQVLKKHLLI